VRAAVHHGLSSVTQKAAGRVGVASGQTSDARYH